MHQSCSGCEQHNAVMISHQRLHRDFSCFLANSLPVEAAAEVLDLNESQSRPASFSFTFRWSHCMLPGGGGRRHCTPFSQGLVSNNPFKWSSAALPPSSVYSDTLYDFNLAAVLHSANQELHNVHFII